MNESVLGFTLSVSTQVRCHEVPIVVTYLFEAQVSCNQLFVNDMTLSLVGCLGP